VVTKCDERAKQATKFGKVVIIESRGKSEETKLEAAKVLPNFLLYETKQDYYGVRTQNTTIWLNTDGWI
jgi:hypothetical protein